MHLAWNGCRCQHTLQEPAEQSAARLLASQPPDLPACVCCLCRRAVKRAAGGKEQGALTVRDVALLLRQPDNEGDAEAEIEGEDGEEEGQGAAAVQAATSPRAAAAAAAAGRAAAAAAAAAAGVPS